MRSIAAEEKTPLPSTYITDALNVEDGTALMDALRRAATFLCQTIPVKKAPLEDSSRVDEETERILAWLNEHFTDSNMTLNLLEETFALSSRYISCLIKRKVGMNYQDYLTSLRISRAQKLLAGTKTLSVTEICTRVGYSSMPHFVRTFKRVTGFTPTGYVRHAWQSQDET